MGKGSEERFQKAMKKTHLKKYEKEKKNTKSKKNFLNMTNEPYFEDSNLRHSPINIFN